MGDPYVSMVESMRRDKDHAFRHDMQSPLEEREAFKGLSYYHVDPGMRFRVTLHRHAAPPTVTLETSDGQARSYRNVGEFRVAIGGKPVTIQAYQQRGSDNLFVPFRDETSGRETYGAGRYLDLHPEGHGDDYDLDFNLAYNPYCAYSDAYSCPFPPRANWLPVPVRAGERAYEPA